MDIAERMKGLAFLQVRAAREAGGGLLDFTPDSLAELDRLISRDVSPRPQDPDTLAEVIGAYLGETIVRRLRGAWCEEGGQPRVAVGGGLLDPLGRARERIEVGPSRSLSAYYRDAEATARAAGGGGARDA